MLPLNVCASIRALPRPIRASADRPEKDCRESPPTVTGKSLWNDPLNVSRLSRAPASAGSASRIVPECDSNSYLPAGSMEPEN